MLCTSTYDQQEIRRYRTTTIGEDMLPNIAGLGVEEV